MTKAEECIEELYKKHFQGKGPLDPNETSLVLVIAKGLFRVIRQLNGYPSVVGHPSVSSAVEMDKLVDANVEPLLKEHGLL